MYLIRIVFLSVLPSFTGKENYWRAVSSTTIISGDWKLIYYYEYERYELFNLKEDISEQNDLSAQRTGIALDLLQKLKNWTKNVNAPVPVVLNERPKSIYTDGDDLQQVINEAPQYSTIICNRNRQLTIDVPIIIDKPLTLKGLNARLPAGLGKSSVIEIRAKGVTITDFELLGNTATVNQNDRAALMKVFFGDFRIERGYLENSSKEGIEVDQQESQFPIDGGTIRDIVGRGCMRDVISLGGPAGPEPHVRNVHLENIRGYNSPLRGSVEVSDGGVNITVSNIYAENCYYAIDIQDHNKQEINRHIVVDNVHAVKCIHAIRTQNHSNGHSNLSITNVTAENCKKTLFVSNTDFVNIQNVKIIGYEGEGPAMSVTNCKILTILDVILADCISGEEGLLIENCNDVILDGVRLSNSNNLLSAVTFRLSSSNNYRNLIIRNVFANELQGAGIILEKTDPGILMENYLITNNFSKIKDNINGNKALIINNLN